jgi:phosphoribosylformylglycinamidine synthase
VGQADGLYGAAELLEAADGAPNRHVDLGVEPFAKVLARDADAQALDGRVARGLEVVDGGVEGRGVLVRCDLNVPLDENGNVTDTGRMVVRHGGKVVVDVPAKKLADEAPIYFRESREAAYMKDVRAFRLDGIPDTANPTADLKRLLGQPTIASKNWVYGQYDHMVRDGSVVCPGSDAAVIRIKGDSLPITKAQYAEGQASRMSEPVVTPDKYVAMSVDCNGTYVYLDPYEGGKAAVAECCRNLACSGAVPLGATEVKAFSASLTKLS